METLVDLMSVVTWVNRCPPLNRKILLVLVSIGPFDRQGEATLTSRCGSPVRGGSGGGRRSLARGHGAIWSPGELHGLLRNRKTKAILDDFDPRLSPGAMDGLGSEGDVLSILDLELTHTQWIT